MIAGSDIANGRANSVTESPCESLSRATSARRVGSASAPKVRSRLASEYLTMWLSMDLSLDVVKRAG
jgi:hypothetical protein